MSDAKPDGAQGWTPGPAAVAVINVTCECGKELKVALAHRTAVMPVEPPEPKRLVTPSDVERMRLGPGGGRG